MSRWAVFFIVLSWTTLGAWVHAEPNRLGLDAKQMVVCIADNASSYEGTLQLFQRDASGKWQADSKPWPTILGRKGLAWGKGLHPPQPGLQKITSDGRNPAGLFKIGMAMGYAPALPSGNKGWPYHQVTDRDAWIDDEKLAPLPYNHLYTLPPGEPQPAWWPKEYMHLGDAAYEWLVLIEHNYTDPEPALGNAIFFHIRRGPGYRSAGCTTMNREDIVHFVKWLDPAANPMLVELTRADYQRFWQEWHLPPPAIALPKK